MAGRSEAQHQRRSGKAEEEPILERIGDDENAAGRRWGRAAVGQFAT